MQPSFYPDIKLVQIQEIKVQTYLMMGSKATRRQSSLLLVFNNKFILINLYIANIHYTENPTK